MSEIERKVFLITMRNGFLFKFSLHDFFYSKTAMEGQCIHFRHEYWLRKMFTLYFWYFFIFLCKINHFIKSTHWKNRIQAWKILEGAWFLIRSQNICDVQIYVLKTFSCTLLWWFYSPPILVTQLKLHKFWARRIFFRSQNTCIWRPYCRCLILQVNAKKKKLTV